MTLEETLNDLLVNLFKDLVEIEGRCLITDEFEDITVNDMHVIEAVGVDTPRNMKTVAGLMNVTMGTLTKSVDGLCRKGYVMRERSQEDKRVIRLKLTDRGRHAFYHHEAFHRQMIENVMAQLSEQESDLLIRTLSKLADYFRDSYSDGSEDSQFLDWKEVIE
ncbi:MAG: winged helix DNA-binding protein [Lachnospiraceae bacterium]|nr:winged helix DNA-binding protein [Lachnospiraceae bacterium]MDD6505335.1 winged helix DNA-binding protein [Lachnospiraceae bacterium]